MLSPPIAGYSNTGKYAELSLNSQMTNQTTFLMHWFWLLRYYLFNYLILIYFTMDDLVRRLRTFHSQYYHKTWPTASKYDELCHCASQVVFKHINNYFLMILCRASHASIVLCPAGLMLIAQTPSGDNVQVSWAGKYHWQVT